MLELLRRNDETQERGGERELGASWVLGRTPQALVPSFCHLPPQKTPEQKAWPHSQFPSWIPKLEASAEGRRTQGVSREALAELAELTALGSGFLTTSPIPWLLNSLNAGKDLRSPKLGGTGREGLDWESLLS